LFGCKKKEEKGKMRRFQVASGEWRVANYPEDLPISFAIPP